MQLLLYIGEHEAQISQIMSGDKAGEAQPWIHLHAHVNTFADGLCDGIAKQFPAKAT